MLRTAYMKLRSTAKLTLAGSLLYAVSNTVLYALSGKAPLSWLNSFLTPIGLARFIFFNRAVFLSSVMYYLFALIYVYLLFILFLKLNIVRHIEKLIPVLLSACVILTEFIRAPWYFSGNFLLTGLPFFMLGRYFAEHRIKSFCIEAGIPLGIVMTLLETRYISKGSFCYIGTLVLSISLFLSCLNYPSLPLPKLIVFFGRNCSSHVFLIHCAVRDHLYRLIPSKPPALGWLRFFCVIAVSSLLSLMMFQMTRQFRSSKSSSTSDH